MGSGRAGPCPCHGPMIPGRVVPEEAPERPTTMLDEAPQLTIKRNFPRPSAAELSLPGCHDGFVVDALGGAVPSIPRSSRSPTAAVLRRGGALRRRPGDNLAASRLLVAEPAMSCSAPRCLPAHRHHGRPPARHVQEQGCRGLRHRWRGPRPSGHPRRRPALLCRRRHAQLAGAERAGDGGPARGGGWRHGRPRRHRRRRRDGVVVVPHALIPATIARSRR